MQHIVKQIKEKAFQLGFLEVGICEAEPLEKEANLLEMWLHNGYQGSMDWMDRTRKERSRPASFFPEAQSIIVVADNYYRSDEPIYTPIDEGNISIYARGRDYHKVLRKKLKALLGFIQEILPGAKGRVCVDSFPIMEKPLAVRAGIGWIGKHTNLIIKGKGSYFFLGEILLSAKLPADEPLTDDYCGSCNKCQVACPTDALREAYVLDATKCISYLTIEHDGEIEPDLQQKIGNWIFGCDICQEVCPWNRFSADANEGDYSTRIPDSMLKLETLSKSSRDEFDGVFRGTPVKRAGFKNFQRNVNIAVRNRDKG